MLLIDLLGGDRKGGINREGNRREALVSGTEDESAPRTLVKVWGFICETDVFVQPGPHAAAARLALPSVCVRVCVGRMFICWRREISEEMSLFL